MTVPLSKQSDKPYNMRIKLILMLLLTSCLTWSQVNQNWKFKADSGIYSSPVISVGQVYFGDKTGHFYALDKYSGKEKWRVELNGAIKSKPAIYKQIIIINDQSACITAMDKKTGEVVWQFNMDGEKQVDMWDYYLSSPTIDGDIVYVGSGDGHIYAINAESGNLNWKFKTGGPVHATPTIHQDVLLIGSFDGYFYALDKVTGKELWQFNTIGDKYFPKGAIQRAACIYNDKVIFGSRDYNIYALDIENGHGHWNYKEPGSWIIATPLLYDSTLYFGTSDTHRFYAMDAESGTIKWQLPLNMRTYGTALALNGRIYFGCFNGKIYGLNEENGAIEFVFQTDESKSNYANLFKSETSFADGVELYGPEARKVEEEILGLGAFLSSPIVDGDMLYIGDANGNFYGLRLD